MKIELTHAHVIDPANAIDEICNLYILDKKIAAVGTAPSQIEFKFAKGQKLLSVLVSRLSFSTRKCGESTEYEEYTCKRRKRI